MTKMVRWALFLVGMMMFCSECIRCGDQYEWMGGRDGV